MKTKREKTPQEKIFIAEVEKIEKQKQKSPCREQVDAAVSHFLDNGGKIKFLESKISHSLNSVSVSGENFSDDENNQNFESTISYLKKRIGPWD